MTSCPRWRQGGGDRAGSKREIVQAVTTSGPRRRPLLADDLRGDQRGRTNLACREVMADTGKFNSGRLREIPTNHHPGFAPDAEAALAHGTAAALTALLAYVGR